MTGSAKASYRGSGRMSLAGFALAMVGTFIGFLPLFQIMLPLKAAELAPAGGTALLGAVAASGAAVAGVANLAIGWLSDRTTSRLGRRRPWIVGGVAGMLVSYALMWRARSGIGLLWSTALFQISLNMVFSPLLALVPDRVPPPDRSRASALIGLGKPLGSLIGTVVIGTMIVEQGTRFLALGGIVVLAIVPFALRLGVDPAPTDRCPDTCVAPGSARQEAHSGLNFMLGCLARICVLVSFAITQTYLLFYVRDVVPGDPLAQLTRHVSVLGVVFGIVSALTVIATGLVSDRIGRRRPFVLAGALVVGAGMLLMAAAGTWPAAIAAYAVFAIGAGMHTAIEFALVVDTLPSRSHAGRDLGILNFANILPQVVAPLGVTAILAIPGAGFGCVFACGGVASLGGAALIALMRSVP